MSATATSSSSSITVTQGTIHFGDVWPGETVASADTITVTVNRTTPFDPTLLSWNIQQNSGTTAPPRALAGASQVVYTGQTVVLDGSRSFDPNGNALNYAWTVVALPSGSKAALAGATTVRPTFIADVDGVYQFQLTVNNGTSTSAPARVTVDTEPGIVPPVAVAGSDQYTPTLQSILLDGTNSTDLNGNTLSYQWSLLSKPAGSNAAIASATSPQATVLPDLAGSYVVQLSASDANGASTPSALVLTAGSTPTSVVPIATVGPDQAATLAATVVLDGTASVDPAGNGVSYKWALLTKPAGSAAALQNPTTAQPTIKPDVAGVYVAQLIVNNGASDSHPVSSVVTTLPAALDLALPLSVPGVDQAVTIGTTVLLSGAASSDPEAEPLSFDWSLINAPAASSAVLSSVQTPTTQFKPNVAGLYVAQLVVNNGVSSGPPQTVRIAVATSPVKAVSDSATTLQNASLTIPVLANDTGGVAPLSIKSVGSPAEGTAVISGTGVVYTPTAGFIGIDSFHYTATDGVTSSEASVTVTVQAPPPNVMALTVTTPLSTSVTIPVVADQPTNQPYPISLNSAVAPTPTRGGTAVISGGAIIYTPPAGVSNYDTFTFGIVNSAGGTATSTVTVLIGQCASLTTIFPQPNPANYVIGDTVQLVGSGSDPGGCPLDPVTYAWTVTSTPAGLPYTLSSAVAANPTLSSLNPGTFTIQLITGRQTPGISLYNGGAVPQTVTFAAVPSVSVANAQATEPVQGQTVPMNFLVSLSGVPPGWQDAISVNYATVNGTAIAGTDFGVSGSSVQQTGTVTFPAGNYAAQTISVPVLYSGVYGSNVTFSLQLSNAIDTTTSEALKISAGGATATILRPVPPVSVTVTPNPVNDVTYNTGTLSLSIPSTAPGSTSVTLSSSNTSVATVSPGPLTLTPGQAMTTPYTTYGAVGSSTITVTPSGNYTSTGAVINVAARPGQVMLQNALLGIGETETGYVSVAAPAPTGGATFSLAATGGTGQSVSPSSVTIAAGATQSGTFTLSGGSAGAPLSVTATATPTAGAYAIQAASVQVTAAAISLGALPALAPGQCESVPVTVTQAPAQPLVITLTPFNASIAGVSPATVTVPAGQTSASTTPTVCAGIVAVPASTTITATATAYAPFTQTASITQAMSFDRAQATLLPSNSTTSTVILTGPAPSGGIIVTLTSSNSGVATVPATVSIAAGQTTAMFTIHGVATGTATISAKVTTPAALNGIAAPSLAVTVGQVPLVLVNGASTASVVIGQDLQSSFAVGLQSAPQSGSVTLTLVANPGVLLSTSATVAGASTLTLSGFTTTATQTVYVQGVNLGSTGSISVRASGGPSYADAAVSDTVVPTGFIMGPAGNGTISTTTLSANTVLTVDAVPLNPTTLGVVPNYGYISGGQPVRPGVTIAVPVTSSNPAAGVITTSPLVFGPGVSRVTTAFQPQGNGTTTIAAIPPAPYSVAVGGDTYSEYWASVSASVVPVNVTLSVPTTIGQNLQAQGYFYLAAAPPSAVTVTLTSNSTNVVLSNSDATAGSSSLSFTGIADASPHYFYVQGQNQGVAMVAMAVTGNSDYGTASGSVTVGPSGFVTTTANFNTSVGAADTAIVVVPALLETTSGHFNYSAQQELNPNVVVQLDVNVSPAGSNMQTCGSGIGGVSVSPIYAERGVGSILDNFVPTMMSGPTGTCAITVTVDSKSSYPFTTPGTGGAYTPTVVATIP